MKKIINNILKLLVLLWTFILHSSIAFCSVAAPNFTINYTNETTNQVVPSTVEYSNSVTMAGSLSGTGIVLPIVPGKTYYFRVKASGSNPASPVQTLIAPSRPATPNYTIDYVNEMTNETVVSTDEYSSSPDMTYSSIGNEARKNLYPGQTLYFRTKATSTSFKSLIQVMVIPSRPNTPAYAIDFINETTSQAVAETDEYSVSSAMTTTIQGKKERITLLPGQNLYFRTKASVTSFKSLTQELIVPARPAAPVYSIDFVNEMTKEVISSETEYSYSVEMQNAITGGTIKLSIVPGQNLYFRKKATSSGFKSTVFALTVPGRTSAPAYTINYEDESTNEGIATTTEISYAADMSNAWPGIDQKIALTPGQNIYFRIKSTDVSFKSNIQKLVVQARPAVPSYSVDFTNETTNEPVAIADAYSTSPSLVNASNGLGNKIPVTPGNNLYFYTRATSSSFKSLSQTLLVPQRGLKPAYSINFETETTSQPVASTDVYSYAADMSNSVSGSGNPISVNPGQTIYFCRNATSCSFKTEMQTLVVSVRPSAPDFFTVNFRDEKTNEIVNPSVEYSRDAKMAYSQAGNNERITLVPAEQVYFRTKATASSFKSEISGLTVPQRPEGPKYSIDFVNEKTKEQVKTTDEYSTAQDMSNTVAGTGNPVTVVPGTEMYFCIKATDTTFRSFAYVLEAPNRPAEPGEPVLDNSDYRFDWNVNPLYPELENYEFSIGENQTWYACIQKPLQFKKVSPASAIKLRIKASNKENDTHFSSDILTIHEENQSVGDSTQFATQLKLYPNPADNWLMIDVKGISPSKTYVKIMDSKGKLVMMDEVKSEHSEMDISALSKGFYVVTISSGKEISRGKILKE